MATFLFILGAAALAYGIAMGALYPAGLFFVVWLLLGAVFAALGWAVHTGAWAGFALGAKCAVIGFFVLFAAFLGVTGGLIVSAASATAPAGLDYLVVLGASLKPDGTPKKTLQLRLDAAVEYLRANPSTVCVVSGGQGNDEPQTEAQGMAAYLQQQGIESARIMLEDKSTSTTENLRFSAKLIGSKSANVGIVTNNFHVYRALQIARKLGYTNVHGIAAPTEVQYLPQATLRECFGIAQHLILGKI